MKRASLSKQVPEKSWMDRYIRFHPIKSIFMSLRGCGTPDTCTCTHTSSAVQVSNPKEVIKMLKKILLSVLFGVVFMVYLFVGAELAFSSNIFDSYSLPNDSIVSAIIYLVICVSMTLFGFFVVIPLNSKELQIDVYDRDKLIMLAIRPLLSGLAMGIAYLSFVEFFGILLTLQFISNHS